MIIKGAKIPNARVGLGGTRAFTLKIGGSPAKRAKAGGQKGRGFRGRIFARPPQFLAEFLPAACGGGLKIGVRVFSVESSNFFQQTP